MNAGGIAELRLRRVERTYPAEPPVAALRASSFDVYSGDLIGITGRSGSGKSTLLNVIGLLDRPTAGSYTIAGVEASSLRESARTALRAWYFGFVFQRHHLLSDRTVAENVEMPLLYRRWSRPRRRRAVLQALSRVSLTQRAGAMPSTLSGGESQRAAIARALVQSPTVLLCDEPTGNLDSATAEQVIEMLLQLNRDGLTIILVTHDGQLADRAHRRLEVDDGAVSERALFRGRR